VLLLFVGLGALKTEKGSVDVDVVVLG